MWLAMCVVYPNLWDEYNGKIPSYTELKTKYEGKNILYNTFIEYLKILESKSELYPSEYDFHINRLKSKFIENINITNKRIFAICVALIFQSN